MTENFFVKKCNYFEFLAVVLPRIKGADDYTAAHHQRAIKLHLSLQLIIVSDIPALKITQNVDCFKDSFFIKGTILRVYALYL